MSAPEVKPRTITGRLLLSGALVPGRLRLEDGRIASIEVDAVEPDSGQLPIVAPGFVDLHVHGYGGCDPLEDLAGMARALARAGTTAFQPTLFPRAPVELGADAEAVWAQAGQLVGAGAEERPPAARPVGLHLEGPFLNPDRAGAIPPEALVAPSVEGLREILGSNTGDGRGVRTVTLAPELAGAADLLEELKRCGVRASLGHSAATAAEARHAARAGGAVGVTHLFNAMSGVHHRSMGLAGFALSDGALFAELIGDLEHVGAEAIELALAARGPGGLCLISDALKGAGTGCDAFHWHGRDHEIHRGAAWFRTPLEAGSEGDPRAPEPDLALAGSAMGQLEMVQHLVENGLLSPAEALTMASETPARALGLEGELGRLAPGARADLVILDGDLERIDVLVGGRAI